MDDDSGQVSLPANSPDAQTGRHAAIDTAADRAAVGVPVASRPVRRRTRTTLLGVAALVLVLAVAAASTLLALTKTVTVTVDGESRSLTTRSSSVAGALDAAALTIGEHDTLAPAAGDAIVDGTGIVVNRGRLLTLTVDGAQRQIWTTARTVQDAMAELGRNPADYQLSADRSRAIPVTGLDLTADTLYDVSVNDRGTVRPVSTVSATVADVLSAQGIALGPNDRVAPALGDTVSSDTTITVITLPTVTVTDGAAAARPLVSDQPTVGNLFGAAGIALNPQDVVSVPLETPLADGLQVAITRITTTQTTDTVALEQPAEQKVDDKELAVGKTKVVQPGQAGAADVVYSVTLTNGSETARVEVSRTVTVEPQPKITHVGSKVDVTPPPTTSVPTATPTAPAPEDPPTASTPPTTAETPPPAGGSTEYVGGRVLFHDFEYGVNWDGLAKCESGNNPRAINPSGRYTGLFQFDDRTWQGQGGSGRAYDAPAEEQLMRAKTLFLQRGLQPWACAYAG